MSIFRETLPKYVQNQLEVRSKVISNTNTRSAPFLIYTSGKVGWTRLSSFVNYNDPKGKYSGDQLARKYILEGGTINKNDNEETLRVGVGSPNSVYLSNLDGFNSRGQAPSKSTSLYNDFRQLGPRPMPGITNVDIVNKSAYGSLKEATVRFYCWDKHQLEELELLYMRTGYTVLLEWGWSQYLESENSVKSIGNGIDIFNNSYTDESIYKKIEELKEKYNGNYDALLGHIKNFSWQLLPNGGYECSTVLISRGEIISTLRLSSNVINDNAQVGENDRPLSTFERVFLNYKAWINTIEVDREYIDKNKSSRDEDKMDKYSRSPQEFKPIYRPSIDIDVENPINETSVANFITELGNKIQNVPKFNVYGYGDKGGKWLPKDSYIAGTDYWNSINAYKGVAIACDAGANDGTAIEYIRLDHFLVILNTYFNLKDERNNLIAKISIPQLVPCLASEDSVSIDPRVCTINNPNAGFITDTDISVTESDKSNPGFQPYTMTSYTYDASKNQRIRTTNRKAMNAFHLSNHISVSDSKKYSYGTINNIYISLNKIVELYRSKGGGNPDGVLMIDYLKELLSQISAALGGINDFQLHVDRDQVKIIDVKYLEVESSDKYKFDLIGLKSICRDVKISSRIFDSQATMIAISAQSRRNIGDLYSSTQAQFNRGLTDRLLSTKVIDSGNSPDETDQFFKDPDLNYYTKLWTSLSNISYYLKEKCIGLPLPGSPDGTSNQMGNIKVPDDASVSNASSVLKTIHYQINGGDVDYKAIIPFELEITLDGISGLVVGQIFTIDKSVLPRDYAEKNIGFIITGINHSLQNNDWVTNIKTQVCLLGQDYLVKNFNISKELKKKIKGNLAQIKAQSIKNQFLAYAITDFLYEKVDAILSKKLFNAKTYVLGTKFLNKSSGVTPFASNFDEYLKTWIEHVKNGGISKTKEKLKTISTNTLADGTKIFPQSYTDITEFTLNGGENNKPSVFSTGLVDTAFSAYDQPYKLAGTNSSVTSIFGSTNISSYFTLRDFNNFSNFQTDAISAQNSALFNRVYEFESTYPEEFVGNIIYTNSIFGRGLAGKISLSDNSTFNLDDQGNNDGLVVKADSRNIKVYNYDATKDKFIIASVNSSLQGKISGIEKYLSGFYLTKENSKHDPKTLWLKLFDYVTKDLLNTSGGLVTKDQISFSSNFKLLSDINGLGMESIYDLKPRVETKNVVTGDNMIN